jgi:hypothetical protein
MKSFWTPNSRQKLQQMKKRKKKRSWPKYNGSLEYYIYLFCIWGTLELYTHIFHGTFTIPASSNASLKKEYHPFLQFFISSNKNENFLKLQLQLRWGKKKESRNSYYLEQRVSCIFQLDNWISAGKVKLLTSVYTYI